MKVSRYLFPTSKHRHKRLFRRSRSDIFSVFGIIKLMFKMMVYAITGVVGLTIFIGTLLYKLIKRIKDYRHYKEVGMNSLKLRQAIQRMQPRQFEIFCNELLNANGYDSEVTVATADGGKDCVAYKDGNKIFVEVKHWRGEIGRVLLQKLIGACIGEKANKAIFITTSWYNSNAVEYAKNVDWLELWDMNDLLKILYNTDVNKVPWIMSKAIEFNEEDVLTKIGNLNGKLDILNNNLDKQY